MFLKILSHHFTCKPLISFSPSWKQKKSVTSFKNSYGKQKLKGLSVI